MKDLISYPPTATWHYASLLKFNPTMQLIVLVWPKNFPMFVILTKLIVINMNNKTSRSILAMILFCSHTLMGCLNPILDQQSPTVTVHDTTSLHMAAEQGNSTALQNLVDKGANVDEKIKMVGRRCTWQLKKAI